MGGTHARRARARVITALVPLLCLCACSCSAARVGSPAGFLSPFPVPDRDMPISLGLLDFSVTASFCGSFINLCAYQFIWSLELTPITYLPNATHPALHQEPVCIGPEPRCQFSSIQEYLTQRGDTSRYLPNGLTIVLPSLATSFSAGYDADVVFIINQLTTLELKCIQPEPTFAPPFLSQMLDFLTAKRGSGSQASASPSPLVSLSLSGCGLTGEVSSGLVGLPELRSLDLSRNLLTGALPLLAPFPGPGHLNLSGNLLMGSVPRAWVDWAACGGVVDLSNNLLSGPLPDELFVSSCSMAGKRSDGLPLFAPGQPCLLDGAVFGPVPGLSRDGLEPVLDALFPAAPNVTGALDPADSPPPPSAAFIFKQSPPPSPPGPPRPPPDFSSAVTLPLSPLDETWVRAAAAGQLPAWWPTIGRVLGWEYGSLLDDRDKQTTTARLDALPNPYDPAALAIDNFSTVAMPFSKQSLLLQALVTTQLVSVEHAQLFPSLLNSIDPSVRDAAVMSLPAPLIAQQPFPFSLLLYNNPPLASSLDVLYALPLARDVSLGSLSDNACTALNSSSLRLELLIIWPTALVAALLAWLLLPSLRRWLVRNGLLLPANEDYAAGGWLAGADGRAGGRVAALTLTGGSKGAPAALPTSSDQQGPGAPEGVAGVQVRVTVAAGRQEGQGGEEGEKVGEGRGQQVTRPGAGVGEGVEQAACLESVLGQQAQGQQGFLHMREPTPHQAGPLPPSLTQHLPPSPAQAVGEALQQQQQQQPQRSGWGPESQQPGTGVSREQQQQQQQVPHAWEASPPRTTPAPALAPNLGQSHHLPALASTSPGPTSTPLTLQTPDPGNSTTATALSPPPHPPPAQPAAPSQAGQLRQGAVEAARRGGRGGVWLQVVSALVNHTRTALLLAWLLLLGASSLAVLLALAQAKRITYCTSPRTPCLPLAYLAPALSLLAPFCFSPLLLLLLLRQAALARDKQAAALPGLEVEPKPRAVAEAWVGPEQGAGAGRRALGEAVEQLPHSVSHFDLVGGEQERGALPCLYRDLTLNPGGAPAWGHTPDLTPHHTLVMLPAQQGISSDGPWPSFSAYEADLSPASRHCPSSSSSLPALPPTTPDHGLASSHPSSPDRLQLPSPPGSFSPASSSNTPHRILTTGQSGLAAHGLGVFSQLAGQEGMSPFQMHQPSSPASIVCQQPICATWQGWGERQQQQHLQQEGVRQGAAEATSHQQHGSFRAGAQPAQPMSYSLSHSHSHSSSSHSRLSPSHSPHRGQHSHTARPPPLALRSSLTSHTHSHALPPLHPSHSFHSHPHTHCHAHPHRPRAQSSSHVPSPTAPSAMHSVANTWRASLLGQLHGSSSIDRARTVGKAVGSLAQAGGEDVELCLVPAHSQRQSQTAPGAGVNTQGDGGFSAAGEADQAWPIPGTSSLEQGLAAQPHTGLQQPSQVQGWSGQPAACTADTRRPLSTPLTDLEVHHAARPWSGLWTDRGGLPSYLPAGAAAATAAVEVRGRGNTPLAGPVAEATLGPGSSQAALPPLPAPASSPAHHPLQPSQDTRQEPGQVPPPQHCPHPSTAQHRLATAALAHHGSSGDCHATPLWRIMALHLATHPSSFVTFPLLLVALGATCCLLTPLLLLLAMHELVQPLLNALLPSATAARRVASAGGATTGEVRKAQATGGAEVSRTRADATGIALRGALTLHLYCSAPLHAAPLAAFITVLVARAPAWGRDSLPWPLAHMACLAVCCATLGMFAGELLAGRRVWQATVPPLLLLLGKFV